MFVSLPSFEYVFVYIVENVSADRSFMRKPLYIRLVFNVRNITVKYKRNTMHLFIAY